jgi:DNA-binding response OmpR family regulator
MAAIKLVQSTPPSLAIIDIEMPKLDGYGVCQLMKEMGPPWNNVPIIFLTSRSSHALELLGKQLGAYVRKSANLENLLDVVSGLMSRRCPVPESKAPAGGAAARIG